MSKEGIATLQHASMGLLCDPRKQEEILNDLWVEWVKLALELELENIVRRRFPGHSEGAYGRLERWIDKLGFIGSDVRFLAQRLWSVIVSWFAPLSKPSVPRPSARLSPMRRKPSPSGSASGWRTCSMVLSDDWGCHSSWPALAELLLPSMQAMGLR
jgi:hypothetical protein